MVSGRSDLLRWFNELSAAAARTELLAVCSAPTWADRMASGRPYSSTQDAVRQSSAILAGLTVTDLAEALATQVLPPSWGGDASTQQAMADGVAEYERRFGHGYLVSCAGRTEHQLLTQLRTRLGNDARAEWQVIRGELQKVNEYRIRRLLGSG
ncbi:MAG TPA: 2-oxo-4-hydroxy-4-carboxy-5-ureidoimidazoline decarboxylase [Streptosporangiaceae bacterium]